MKPTVTLAFDSVAQMVEFFAGRVNVQVTTAPTITATAGFAQPSDDEDSGPINATAPALDSRGLPHDERIHAPKKTLNADGSWRKKRGVAEALVAQCEAEARAAQGQVMQPTASVPMPQQPAAPQFGQQPPPMFNPMQAPQFGQQPPAGTYPPAPQPTQYAPPPQFQPVAAPEPVAPPAPVQPVPQSPAVVDFSGFMTMLQRSMQAGKIDAGYINYLVQKLNAERSAGITAITDIHARPDLIEYAAAVVNGEGRGA